MILNYSPQEKASAQGGASMGAWISKLSEGKKSTQQLQTEMLQGATDAVKDIQDKAIEKAKEAAKEEASKETSSQGSSETKPADDIKAPSEVTKADLESPIDIKL